MGISINPFRMEEFSGNLRWFFRESTLSLETRQLLVAFAVAIGSILVAIITNMESLELACQREVLKKQLMIKPKCLRNHSLTRQDWKAGLATNPITAACKSVSRSNIDWFENARYIFGLFSANQYNENLNQRLCTLATDFLSLLHMNRLNENVVKWWIIQPSVE